MINISNSNNFQDIKNSSFAIGGRVLESRIVDKDGRKVREITKFDWDHLAILPNIETDHPK